MKANLTIYLLCYFFTFTGMLEMQHICECLLQLFASVIEFSGNNSEKHVCLRSGASKYAGCGIYPLSFGIYPMGQSHKGHSRTQSPSYARCDEGLWPNPYSEVASDWLVLTPDIVFLPCFYGIRLWIWPEPLVAPRVRRALGTRMHKGGLALPLG